MASSTGDLPRSSLSATLPSWLTVGSMKSGAVSPARNGGRRSLVVIQGPFRQESDMPRTAAMISSAEGNLPSPEHSMLTQPASSTTPRSDYQMISRRSPLAVAAQHYDSPRAGSKHHLAASGHLRVPDTATAPGLMIGLCRFRCKRR